MLLVNPDRRYSLKEVCKHKWLHIAGPDPHFNMLVEECNNVQVKSFAFNSKQFQLTSCWFLDKLMTLLK